MRVLLTGGGTAGHINPALAIAELIRRNSPGAEIAFVGIHGGKEDDLVPREGYRLYYVRSKGIRRSVSPSAMLSNAQALWLAAWSPYARPTLAILDGFRPDIVIGTGGYACWPIMAAAARRGIPTALHESNALPGLAVRKLQKRVDRIWTNFEGTAGLLGCGDRVKRVGNPLRGGFGTIPRDAAKEKLGLDSSEKLVLCFGGSLGAEPLNRAVIEAMRVLAPKRGNVRFCLASGKRDYAALSEVWRAAGLDAVSNCTLFDYIYDMPLWMSAADVAVTRAGAMTLSELGRMSLPSVLIPSPHVADNHQYLNAKTFADAGAAVLVEEKELENGRLTAELEALLGDDARLLAMSHAAGSFAGSDAGRCIWEDILELTEKREAETEGKRRRG